MSCGVNESYGVIVILYPESCFFFFSSRRRHTRFDCDWSSDVCSSDLAEAAEALKLTPEDLKQLHLIDEIIPEPEGGAQNDPAAIAKCLASVLERQLRELQHASPNDLVSCRHKKRSEERRVGKECRSRWS